MTPLEIEILFHYNSRDTDYRAGDFSAPAVREAISGFRDNTKLLEVVNDNSSYCTYRLTERGKVYISELCKLPLPVQEWVMPANSVLDRLPPK
mgnify:FL=1